MKRIAALEEFVLMKKEDDEGHPTVFDLLN
jgi:hypothetical protein